MNRQTDTIEVDKATADKLKERAAELGMTVDEFLAAIASEKGAVRVDPGEIDELDRCAGHRSRPGQELSAMRK